MKVSIVTCTWNSETTLCETLASVASQTYPDIEHIIVDGGSTDKTLALVADYGKATRVLLDQRGGIARAMNVGLGSASGDIVAHLHSDDYYSSPDVVAEVVASARGMVHPWIVGRTDTLKDGRLFPCKPIGQFSSRRYRARGFFIGHPSTFMARELMNRLGGFNEGLRYAMDIDLWLRALRIAEPRVLEAALTVFRAHKGSASHANECAARREEWRVRSKYVLDDPIALPMMHYRSLKSLLMSCLNSSDRSRS